MENQPALIEVPPNSAPVLPAGFYTGKPRPACSAPEVLINAVNKLMPEIMAWGEFEEHEAESVAEDVMSAFKYEAHDGDKLARYLENNSHWDSDSGLADILENADIYRCHKESVMAWIKDNAVVPVFLVGAHVSVKERRQSEMHIGTIRSITDDGMYCVMVPALGHVAEGLGTHGILLPWEDVEAWNGAGAIR